MKKILKNKKACIVAVIVLATAFLWNNISYLVPRLLAKNWHHYDMTTVIDEMIPFLPWTVSIYFGCYVFWGINYCWWAFRKESERTRFFSADFIAKAISFVIFLLLPTTNVRPDIADTDVWGAMMKFLYTIDAPDNLFPSLHCLVSWLCWVGIRKNKSVPPLYRHLSLVAALAICISTLTTRQHVIADVIGGIILAELCYFLAGHTKISSIYSWVITKIKALFRIQE